jgi:hypothetical protein
MVRSVLLLAAGAAIGAALLIAHRVSQETGKSMPEAFADVPSEARRIFEEVKQRAEMAMERGRQAYQEKQSAIEQHMSGVSSGV